MADMLGIHLWEESGEGRAQRLWLSLKEKRILVIIDDLWREFNLMDIGIRLDNVNKVAWKILLTTRDQQVCISMGCQKKINVGLLSEDESWTLFQKRANINDEFSELLDGVPRKLCDECKGLPLAVVTMASSLKGKHKIEWELALGNLRDSEAFDDHEGVRVGLSCLQLSYDYFKNKEAELLFLMCSMFPENYNIPIEDLMRYAIGLGVGGISSLKAKRSLIQAGINELLDSCLLIPSEYSEDCVMMHDLVRDTALQIAKRSENHKILVNFHKPLSTLADDDSIRDCFAVSSWHNENPIFHQLHAPNLEMLLLNINTSRSSNSFNSFNLSHLTFEGIEGLKVFALTSASYNFKLPPSTQLLTNVRTLRLNGLELGDISFIASLTTLEVLDLQGCDFDELPNEIGKLRRLKLLDLSRCHIFQEVYNGAIGKCSQLEELYASKCKQEYIYQSVEEIVTLPKLQRLVMQATSMNILHYGKSSTSIGLMDFNISKLRAFKKNILKIAETIGFERLRGGCKNIIPDMVGVVGGMNYLTTLYLNNCPEIECIFDTISDSKVDDSIPELFELRLERMENLKELFRGPPLQVQRYFEKLEILDMWDCVQLHSLFPWECNLANLKSLTIWDCTSIEVLFLTSIAQSMQQLEKLIIKGCHELKHVIASGREHGCSTSEQIVPAPRNSHSLMPSLRQVYIHDCPKLESIFPICYVEGLAQLQEMDIRNARELKYVFGECDDEHHSSDQYQNHIMLPYLEVLKLNDLENLLGICPKYCHAKWPSQSLTKLTVEDCPKLATSWITVMAGSDQRQHHLNKNIPSKLQELVLCGLPQLSFISWVRHTPGQIWSLQYLQLLEVNDCEKLKSLFSIEVYGSLPELMSLCLYGCQELEHIVAANEELVQLPTAEVYFPKLKKIEVKNCNKLKSLFPVALVKMLPQLSILCISRAIKLEEVFKHDIGEDIINEMEIVLPNLSKITLDRLPSFVDICQGYKLQARKLQQLHIHECPKTAPSLKTIQVTLEEAEGVPDNINEDVHRHSSLR